MISENKKVKSNFVTYLSVKDNAELNLNLIQPFVDSFFSEKGIDNYQSIAENSDISDLDFKLVEFSYFYDFIFNDIKKVKGEIQFSIKYCITLDKTNCPKACEETGIFYDEITLSNKPVFYFIFIDINDIFSFLRN